MNKFRFTLSLKEALKSLYILLSERKEQLISFLLSKPQPKVVITRNCCGI